MPLISRKWHYLSKATSRLKSPSRSSSPIVVETGAVAGGSDAGRRRLSLEGLPVELLELIIESLVTGRDSRSTFRDVFRLAFTCRRLAEILPYEVLYEHVIVFSKHQAQQLAKTLRKSKSPLGSFIKTFCFVKPEDDSSATILLGTVGYSFSSFGAETRQPCPDLILDLVSMMPNLANIYLDEIVPGFKFPASLEKSKVVQQIWDRPHAVDVFLSPETGWTNYLHFDTLWAFGKMNSLHLCNTQINDQSLSKPLKCQLRELILSGCTVKCDVTKVAAFFGSVESFVLDNVRNINDIGLSYEFKSTKSMTLSLIGKSISRRPRNETLIPATGILPHNYTDSQGYRVSADCGNTNAGPVDLRAIFGELARLTELRELRLVLPKPCFSSNSDVDQRYLISENIGLLENVCPVTLVLPRAFDTANLPDVRVEYA